MGYVGGKSRGGDLISNILNHKEFNGKSYLEPFVGYANVLRRIVNKSEYIAGDNNENLITLLKFLKTNMDFPVITKEEYGILKTSNESSVRKSFAAFAYSYNGKEFCGYRGINKKTNKEYAEPDKKYYKRLQENETFKKTTINLQEYYDWNPLNNLIYCDPPYRNTIGYGVKSFDTDKFWNVVRKWSCNNWVFVSEYEAPPDFKCVLSFKKHCVMSGKCNDICIENLFIHESLYEKYCEIFNSTD